MTYGAFPALPHIFSAHTARSLLSGAFETMRAYEILVAAFFATFVVVAAVVPVARRKRFRAMGIGGAGIAACVLLPELSRLAGGAWARDLLPGFLLLLAYWQTGQFMVGSSPRVQAVLEGFDERWFGWVRRARGATSDHAVARVLLEAAYLTCYPLVPLGVVALHLGGRGELVEPFWLVVLPATLATHALTPVFQSAPPWAVHAWHRDPAVSGVQALNRWVTEHASIRANSFPSGHVASSCAVGLVLVEAIPLLGLAFLGLSAGIALSSLLLGYHYALDVVLGGALAGASYLLVG